jgi:hypothetical protein
MNRSIDVEALLNQPLFGWDTLSLLGDVEDFLDFSEANIEWQLQRELRRVHAENELVQLDDPSLEAQYKDQQIESVEYRFSVSLTQRVRYSGLTSLITSIEWSLLVLRNLATFKVPDRPERTSEAVHLLSVFAKAANQDLQREIKLLELLVQVRNCIVHSAGRIGTYKHAGDLRAKLVGFVGIKLSTANFLGEGVEIEPGFLQGVLEKAKLWLPSLEKAMYEQGLLRK